MAFASKKLQIYDKMRGGMENPLSRFSTGIQPARFFLEDGTSFLQDCCSCHSLPFPSWIQLGARSFEN
jgi:hypothetical protein